MRKHEIFVSFASDDRDSAAEIEVALRKRKYSVFMSDSDISPGDTFDAEIEKKIKSADGIIFLVSRSFLQEGRYTLTEVEYAKQRWRDPSGRILPVLLDGVAPDDLPAYLRTVSCLEPKGNLRAEVASHAARMWPARSWTPVAASIAAVLLVGGGSFIAYQYWPRPEPPPPPPAPVKGPPPGMAEIAGGWFTMGSTLEEVEEAYKIALKSNPTLKKSWKWREVPDRKVKVDAFYIDIHEVTVGAYQRFKSGTPGTGEAKSGVDRFPQTGVSYAEAVTYCGHVGKRLPTEAEWEKAARSIRKKSAENQVGNNQGGWEQFTYPWGNEQVDSTRANYCDSRCREQEKNNKDDGQRRVAPVGSYERGMSKQGVYNLAGNVAEWVADWYQRDFYTGRGSTDDEDRTINPLNKRKPREALRVVRGGDYQSGPVKLRAAYRTGADPKIPHEHIGFRCAKPVPANIATK